MLIYYSVNYILSQTLDKEFVFCNNKDVDDKNISNQEKKAPLGVKIVAIIPVVPVLIFLFFDIAMIMGPLLDSGDSWVYVMYPIVLFFFLVFTACLIFTSVMLWKGKNWARIALIIFYIIGIIFSLWTYRETPPNLNYFSLIGSVFSLPAVFYLIFNKKVKEFFKRNSLKDIDDKNISNQEKKVPLGVKIVAILSIFFPYACFDFVILTSLPQENITFLLMFTPFPLLLLIPKIFTIFIAIMLWMGKNWARIALIIFFVIVTFLNLWIGLNWNHYFPFSFSLSANYDYIVEIVFSLFAIFYLIFNKKVKEFFKKPTE